MVKVMIEVRGECVVMRMLTLSCLQGLQKKPAFKVTNSWKTESVSPALLTASQQVTSEYIYTQRVDPRPPHQTRGATTPAGVDRFFNSSSLARTPHPAARPPCCCCPRDRIAATAVAAAAAPGRLSRSRSGGCSMGAGRFAKSMLAPPSCPHAAISSSPFDSRSVHTLPPACMIFWKRLACWVVWLFVGWVGGRERACLWDTRRVCDGIGCVGGCTPCTCASVCPQTPGRVSLITTSFAGLCRCPSPLHTLRPPVCLYPSLPHLCFV